jgi:hypothetical protein
MLAQSQASVPPAPAWMSTKTVQRVGRIVEHAAEFQPFDEGGQLGSLALDGEQAGLVAVVLAHLEQFEVVGQLSVSSVMVTTTPSSAFFSLPSSWARLGSFQTVPGLLARQQRCAGVRLWHRSQRYPRKVFSPGAQVRELGADLVDAFCFHDGAVHAV